MPKSNCTSVAAWELWFASNPLTKGFIGDTPVEWLQWLREAPAVMVDASGQDTTFQRAAGARTSVCGLRSQRGSALLETAICLPILLLVVLGGIDLTNAFRCKNSLDYITTQAAKCIVTHGCDPQALVAANAAGLTLNPANLTVTTDAGTATATASYLYQPFGPFFPRITLTARASAAQ